MSLILGHGVVLCPCARFIDRVRSLAVSYLNFVVDRCVMCTDIYLCQTCFNGPSHIQHRFHYKEVCRLCYVTEYYCLYFAYNFCSTFSSRIILLKHTQLSKLRLKHSGLFFFPDMDLTLIKVYGVCSFKMCGIELHSVRCKIFVREKKLFMHKNCTRRVVKFLCKFIAEDSWACDGNYFLTGWSKSWAPHFEEAPLNPARGSEGVL